MAPRCSSMAGKKRARNEESNAVRLRPIVTTRLLEVESSNPDEERSSNGVEEECNTPRGKENRIAELLTCPPPPRKQRRINTCRRRLFTASLPPFFTSPDLDDFFLPLYKICKR